MLALPVKVEDESTPESFLLFEERFAEHQIHLMYQSWMAPMERLQLASSLTKIGFQRKLMDWHWPRSWIHLEKRP